MIKIEVLAENKDKKAYDLRSDALKALKTIRKPITNKHDGGRRLSIRQGD